VFSLVLFNIVINDLEETLSSEVTAWAENHKIRVAETKGGWSCRRFSQYLVVGQWYLILVDGKQCTQGETSNCAYAVMSS